MTNVPTVPVPNEPAGVAPVVGVIGADAIGIELVLDLPTNGDRLSGVGREPVDIYHVERTVVIGRHGARIVAGAFVINVISETEGRLARQSEHSRYHKSAQNFGVKN